MKDFNNEIWKPIIGFEGFYEVSSEGRVKSLDRYVKGNRGGQRLIKGKILKGRDKDHGYLQVDLGKEGKKTHHSVSILVATAFIPNPENKPEVDHINTIRTDNRVENLRWATRKENMDNPLTVQKIKEALCKPIIQYNAFTDEVIARWDSLIECSRSTGIKRITITSNLRGRSKVVSKQFYFRYA